MQTQEQLTTSDVTPDNQADRKTVQAPVHPTSHPTRRASDTVLQPRGVPRSLPFNAKWRRRLLASVVVLLVGSSVYQLSALDRVQRELARRVQDSDALSQEAKVFAKEASNSVRDIQDRIVQMEERIASSQSQQSALEQLYRDLAQNRDDWVLAEVEQTLQTASQQLQLSGNVSGALTALQTADNRLARTDRPQYLPLRKALAQDIDRLKALPALDMAGLVVKLDNLVSSVDKLPLFADESVPQERTVPAMEEPAALPDRSEQNAWDRTVNRWKDRLDQFTSRLWAQISQLIRVREVAQPDALLLTPAQSYFVRENLKLRLLNARLALMSRNDTAFRADLALTREWLERYFDTRQRNVQVAQEQLKSLASSNLTLTLPTLAESLAAVRKLSAVAASPIPAKK